MGLIIIIIGILVCILGCILWYMDVEEPVDLIAFGFGAALMVFGLCYDSDEKHPKAIDVYRDKTTLEITYKDGVPVDSVVVFK